MQRLMVVVVVVVVPTVDATTEDSLLKLEGQEQSRYFVFLLLFGHIGPTFEYGIQM